MNFHVAIFWVPTIQKIFITDEGERIEKDFQIRKGRLWEADRVFMVTWLPQVIDDMYEDNKLDSVLECIEKLEEAQNEDQV